MGGVQAGAAGTAFVGLSLLTGLAAMYWPASSPITASGTAKCPSGFKTHGLDEPVVSVGSALPAGHPPVFLGIQTGITPPLKLFTNASIWTGAPEVRHLHFYRAPMKLKYVVAQRTHHQVHRALAYCSCCSSPDHDSSAALQAAWADTIAVRDGRVVAVGTVADVVAQHGVVSEIVDLQGRFVTPVRAASMLPLIGLS